MVVCLLLTLFSKAQKNLGPATFAKTITVSDLKKHLSIVASAEMEGRETATPGQRKAAAYIEQQFKTLGLLPGNKESYQMYFPVYRDSLTNAILQVNEQNFLLDKDFSPSVYFNISGTYKFSEVVFVGQGRSDSVNNDYKNVDVKGKAVMFFDNLSRKSNSGGRALYNKFIAAWQKGAAAVLLINNFPESIVTHVGNMYLSGFKKSIAPQRYSINEDIARAIMGSDYDTAKSSNAIISKVYTANVLLNTGVQTLELKSSNVIGLIEGSNKKDEYVFLTAHYDHLGKKDTVIWYGADDDGSGTVGVIEMAEAFAKAKAAGKGPGRTVVFMTVSGEEKGLWGSEYYSDHPVFPLEKISVDINTDMVGRTDTDRKTGDSLNYVYVIGHDRLSSELHTINEAANNKYTQLKLDYKYDDPKDKERIYYRSDHYNFARKGVPILFFYDGMLLADYHKPTDTVDKINWALYEKRVRMIFYTAWEMANRDSMLKRDIALPVTAVCNSY